jgi:myo-inositol-1(or 4)-monophosphatase
MGTVPVMSSAPPGLDWSSVRDTTIAAAAASRDLLRGKAARDPRRLEGRDIKLVEDEASEALIVAALQRHSAWPILSEEAGWIGNPPGRHEPYWAVDPLDGSFNHHRGVPLCCTSVALCRGLRPLAGAVFDFNRDEMFWGGAGLGLSLNGEALAPPPHRADIVTTGFPAGGDYSPEGIAAMVERVRAWRKVRMIGSAALSLAWVAAGRFDYHEESGTRWWDVAGGLALVEGAGGMIEVEGDGVEAKLTVRARRAGD